MDGSVSQFQQPPFVISPSIIPSPAPLTNSTDDDEVSIVITTSLAHFLCHFGELLFPSVMVAVMAEYALERNQITWLPLFGYMLMGLGALPFGMWADAWSPRKILFIYFVALGVGALAVAAAPTVELLVAALTLFGLALSIYHPVGLAMISLGVRARGRALGINGVAGSLGLSMSPLLAALALALGAWRIAYVVFAALAAISSAAFLFSKHGLCLARREHRRPELPPQVIDSLAPPASLRSYIPLALLMLVMMLGGLNYRCLVTALPPFLFGDPSERQARFAVSTIGLLSAPAGPWAAAAALSPGRSELSLTSSAARSGGFTFVILLAGGIGQILGGWLADRFTAGRVYAYLVFLLIPLGVLIALVGGTLPGVVFASCLAIGLFGQQPVENSLLAEYTTRARRSRAYALKFMFTFGIGSFGSIIVGQLWQETNTLNSVFYLIAASGVVMTLLLAAKKRLASPIA